MERESHNKKPYKLNIYKGKPEKLIFHASFLIALFFIYRTCIFAQDTLVYRDPDINSDTYNNYYSVYVFLVNMVSENGFSFFSFVSGLGTNIFSIISYIFDPFSIVPITTGLVLGTEYIAYSFVWMQMLKIIAAALLTYYYLSILKFSAISCYIGAFVYALSGFMMGAGQHYSFATIPVLLMLLLYLYERSLKYEKGYWLISIAVALIALNSIYYAYMVGIFFLLYILMRPPFVLECCTWRTYREKVIPFLVSGVIGVLLSGVITLPSAFTIVGLSGRVSSEGGLLSNILAAFSPSSIEDIIRHYAKFLSDNIWGTPNTFFIPPNHFEHPHYFISTLFVLLVPQFIFNVVQKQIPMKKKVLLFFSMLIIVFATVNNFIPSMFNVFVGPMYRWTYILCPIFVFLIAYTLDEIIINKKFSKVLNITICVLSILFSVGVYYYYGQRISLIVITNIVMSIGGCTVLLHYLGQDKKLSSKMYQIATYSLVLVVLANVVIDANMSINPYRTFTTQTDVHDMIFDEDFSTLLDRVEEEEGDNFYRVEHTLDAGLPQATYGPIMNYRSLSVYNSTLNGNVKTFANTLTFARRTAFPPHLLSYQHPKSYGQQYNFVLADNLGLKYIVADEKVDMENWEEISEVSNQTLYRNTNINSAGLLYDNYLTEEEYYALPMNEKMLVMGDSLILSSDVESVSKSKGIEDKTTINLFESEAVQFENIVSISRTEQDQTIHGKANEDAHIEIFFEEDEINVKNRQSIIEFTLDFSEPVDMKILFDTGDGYEVFGEHQGVQSNSEKSAFYLPQNAKSMKVEVSSCIFAMRNAKIYQNEVSYVTDQTEFRNPNYASTVLGEVEAKDDAILYLPIPFEEGFTATLDGEEVPILKANFGFSALEVPEGNHTVEFTFYPPWMNYGIVLSIIGVIGMILMCMYYRKRGIKYSERELT